jgi:hypothetical protein
MVLGASFVVMPARTIGQSVTPSTDSGKAVGIWLLNPNESKLSKTNKTKSETVHFSSSTPTTLVFTADAVEFDGSTSHAKWEGAPDGVLRPADNEPDGEQFSFRWVNGSLVGEEALPTGLKFREVFSFSADGKTMTVTRVLHKPEGDIQSMVAVFHRNG